MRLKQTQVSLFWQVVNRTLSHAAWTLLAL